MAGMCLKDKMYEEVNLASEIADNLYLKHFGNYFKQQEKLYLRDQDQSRPVTDEELEKILTELPLEMIEVSEAYAKFQLGEEVIKLRTKEEAVDKTSDAYKEYELMSKIYSSVNERVRKQISFSRELIMSCKKIWDRRKDTDMIVPIGPSVEDSTLPEYTPSSKQTYVK